MIHSVVTRVEAFARLHSRREARETFGQRRVAIRLEPPAVPRPQHHDEHPDQAHRATHDVADVGLETVQPVPCGGQSVGTSQSRVERGMDGSWLFVWTLTPQVRQRDEEASVHRVHPAKVADGLHARYKPVKHQHHGSAQTPPPRLALLTKAFVSEFV